jgi:hypothetical protein
MLVLAMLTLCVSSARPFGSMLTVTARAFRVLFEYAHAVLFKVMSFCAVMGSCGKAVVSLYANV